MFPFEDLECHLLELGHWQGSLDSLDSALWRHVARTTPSVLEHWSDRQCHDSRDWLELDILVVGIEFPLQLEVPMDDAHERKDMLLTAWSWKEALECHASWLLLHTSAEVLLLEVAADVLL